MRHALSLVGRITTALFRDERANSLPIFAASLVPLLAVVGGGVDASRGYLTKTQLQNACDAGVLAGRRAMAKSGTYEDTEKAKATRMFDANFDAGLLEATNVSFVTQAGSEGDVTGQATARIPTLLMHYFGSDNLSFNVDCMAELQIANTDVMFVLDTTGSMAGTRIAGLRDAVRDFHTTIASSVVDDDVRVRYGFVPYGMTVNARTLLTSGAMPADYISDTVSYQSRRFAFTTPKHIGTAGSPSTVVETYGSTITSAQCDKYGDNDYPSSGNNPVNSGTAPSNTTQITYTKNSWTKTSGSGSSAKGTCKRNKRTVVTSYTTVYENSGFWRYIQTSLNVAPLKTFGNYQITTAASSTATTPTSGYHDVRTLAQMSGTTGLTKTNYTWGGCIEERATVQDATMNPVPWGATDLDINSAPDSDDTRWKPYFGPVEFYRNNNHTYVDSTSNLSSATEYCPAPMQLYREVDLTPNVVPTWLNTYLNNLTAAGGTYHDIGMIWGGRLGSPNGIFADVVDDEPDRSTSRHVIFMTDGEMAPETDYYSAYGLEKYDNRVAPQGTDRSGLVAWHNARFIAACNAIKDEGYTVWVIGFGSSLTSQMQACATGHRAYFSNNVTELRATFRYIASQVADLRLGA